MHVCMYSIACFGIIEKHQLQLFQSNDLVNLSDELLIFSLGTEVITLRKGMRSVQ